MEVKAAEIEGSTQDLQEEPFEEMVSEEVIENEEDEPSEEEDQVAEAVEEENEDAGEEDGDEDEDDDDDDDEEDEEDEEDPIDPLDTLRESCNQTKMCRDAMSRFEECEARVSSKNQTEETCTEEILDFFKCQDYCMAKELFHHLK